MRPSSVVACTCLGDDSAAQSASAPPSVAPTPVSARGGGKSAAAKVATAAGSAASGGSARPQFGSKLRQLVATIRALPRGDRCLVFVQFDDLMEVVARALADGGVKAQQLKGSVHQKTAALGGFQREDGGSAPTTCLLLNIGNESAAGANLTVANHAIFVHPILADSEHLYTVRAAAARLCAAPLPRRRTARAIGPRVSAIRVPACGLGSHGTLAPHTPLAFLRPCTVRVGQAWETQAIGRIRRYGQTKKVEISRFLVEATIDQEIALERSGITLEPASAPVARP